MGGCGSIKMDRETDKTHFQIKTTKGWTLEPQKRGRREKAVMQKWRRRGIFLSYKLKFPILLLPQVQIHAVRRGCLINYILFTSELNLKKISSPLQNVKNTIICYTYS